MPARRVEGLQFERVADEILVVKPGTLEAHAPNQSAAAVFDLCDGKASKFDMAAAIQRRTLPESSCWIVRNPRPRFSAARWSGASRCPRRRS